MAVPPPPPLLTPTVNFHTKSATKCPKMHDSRALLHSHSPSDPLCDLIPPTP